MSKNTQLDMVREAANRPPYKQIVYVNAGQLLAEIEREYLPLPMLEGEPLIVGDMVNGYNQEGAEVVAVMNSEVVVVRSTVRGGNGYHDEAYPLLLWDVSDLARHNTNVLDADGVPIRKGDTVYATRYGYVECTVISIEWVCDGWLVEVENCGGHKFRLTPDEFTHKQPDSLERIEEDALMASIDYCNKYGLLDSGCNAEEGDDAVRHCTDCGLTCENRMINHLLRRQREVLERGNGR